MSKVTVIVLLFLTFSLPVKEALAQTSPLPGFTVSPAILKLDLSADAPEADISYTNNTASDATISFKAQDFTSLDEGWQVKFLEQKDAQNYQFSLSSWLKFSQDQMAVKSGETQTVRVSINKDELSSGTHYAAIIGLIKSQSPDKNVNVVTALSTLLFVRSANGHDIEDGTVDSFQPVRSFLEFPSRFTIRFRNSGNVDLTPHGLVSIYNPFNRQVSKAILNDGSLITLPESIRRYDITTTSLSEGQFLWPGRYTAVTSTHFGKSDKQVVITSYFWTLGSLTFTEVLIALIILVAALVGVKKFRKRS
jgi:hypothetical protein